MGVSRRSPAPTSLCYIPLKHGACYIPLVARGRATAKDCDPHGIGGLVVPGAPMLHSRKLTWKPKKQALQRLQSFYQGTIRIFHVRLGEGT